VDVPKNLGMGVDFWPSSEGDFLTVRANMLKSKQVSIPELKFQFFSIIDVAPHALYGASSDKPILFSQCEIL
jgi:hypothetical protein